jgi:outer membrane protein assembly factor BamE
MPTPRIFLPAFCAAAALALLAGCSVPRIPGITPYKMDIQQGNYVSQEMVAQLKPGLTKDQVRFTLGTPLLTDIFHGERWDYVYWREDPAGKREQRKLAVYFQDGKLARIEGDVVPAAEAAKPADAPKPPEAPK